MKEQCEAMVSIDTWHKSRCGNRAKVEFNGKSYCGIHNPLRLQKLAAKRKEEYHKGDCPKCGTHPHLPQYSYCPWCGTKLKE